VSDRARILVVDDDREIVFGTRLRLHAAGYETLVARDGYEAVASARTDRPAAILLDVRMPRLDGLAALGELKRGAETNAIPVVMVSASMRDQQAALESGARFFLSKPYEYDNLLAALETVLRECNFKTEEPPLGVSCHAQV
jgi:two-component system KDP operon response regulator KdpE